MNIMNIDDLQKYMDDKPESVLFPLLAENLLKNDNIAEAEEICRAGLSYHKDMSEGYYVLANILLKKGNILEAVKQLQNTISYQPNHINAHKLLLLIGKENLSLSEIDDSHKVIENYEKNIRMTPEMSHPYFHDSGFEEEPPADIEDHQAEPFPDDITDPDLSTFDSHDDELDLSGLDNEAKDYKEEDKIVNEHSRPEKDFIDEEFELDIDDAEDIDQPDFHAAEEKKLGRAADNPHEPAHDAAEPENFELDIEPEDSEMEQPEDEGMATIDELDLDESMDFAGNNFTFDEEEETEETAADTLSIKPVADNFNTNILKEIEENQPPSESEPEEEEPTEPIPDFKNNLKPGLNETSSPDPKEKINLNIPIPTMTFVEVLKNQKLYDQALEILDLLEKRSSEKDKIIRKKEEIIKLKIQNNY